jgi:hypothetical protein
MTIIVADLMNCRFEEHRYASDVLLGSDRVALLALQKLRFIVERRRPLTKSVARAALFALHNSNVAVQTQAALMLLSLADKRSATAIRWCLQGRPHEMVASILKETLAKISQ